MSFVHGKGGVIKLDDLDGSLTDISALANTIKYQTNTDRPETQTFGFNGRKRQVTGLRDASLSLTGYWQQVAATKLHGKSTKVLVDEFPLTSYVNKTSVRRSIDLPETQCFGETWKRRQVVGLQNADVSFSGLFDAVASGIHQVFRTMVAVDPPGFSVITIGANGYTIGNMVEMFQGVAVNYNVDDDVNAPVPLSASIASDDQYDVGVSLHDLTAETTAGTVNYTSVDETDVSTASGGVGHIHVSAYSGWADATVKVQDSADNAAWADILTFTVITGVTKERKETSATATIRRYIRATVTFTGGAGSMTFVVTFARRAFAYGVAGTHRHFCGLLQPGQSTSTFEYGPEGGAAGKRKLTGECRASGYSVEFDENGTTTYSLDLVSDAAVTETTF